MANEIPQNPPAPAAPAPAVPAVPDIAAAPAATVEAPAAPARAAQPARTPIPTIRIPQKEFVGRVRREAETVVARKLGMTLDEAAKRLKAGGGGAAPAAAAAPGAPAAPANGSRKDSRAARELDEMRRRNGKLKKQNEKIKANANARIIEERIKGFAMAAGITDPDNLDFALQRYMRTAATTPQGKEPPQPEAFFAGMREKQSFLFSNIPAAAAPAPAVKPSVPVTTSPPASTAPGAPPLVESTKPSTSPAVDVNKMSPREFADHKRQAYGA